MRSLAADMDYIAPDIDIGNSMEKPEELYRIHTFDYWFIITQYLNLILCIVNFGANVFLIYIILRFKRLRNRTNYYILNFAITNAIYHVSPLISVIFQSHGHIISFKLICYIYLIEEGALFTTFLFGCVVALDWYLANYHGKFIHLHPKLYALAIPIVYIVGIIRYIVISTNICVVGLKHIFHFRYMTYILSLVPVIAVNILRCRRQRDMDVEKTKYSLIVANIIVFSWLPLFCYYGLMVLDVGSYVMYDFLIGTILLPKAIAHTNTIVVLFVLGRINKQFKMAYGRAFRRGVTNYGSDDLDRDSDDEARVEHRVNVARDSDDEARVEHRVNVPDSNDVEPKNDEES